MKTVPTKKRIVALLLALLMLVTVFAQSAAAVQAERTPIFSEKASVRVKLYTYPKSGASMAVAWDALTDYIYKHIKAYNTAAFDILKFKVPASV